MFWKIKGNEKQYILTKFLGQFKVLNTHIFIKCCRRHLYISLMHLICPPPPPKFCITFVFHFSWVLQPSQKKFKTVLIQNVGDTFKVHYGRCASGVCLAGFLITWDQALFTFRFENDIPAGKAKRKESPIQTFYETFAAHFFDWLTFAESANQNYFRPPVFLVCRFFTRGQNADWLT